MDDGFDMSELSGFSRHLLDLAQDRFPAETKQFLRKQGSELAKQTKALARERVGKNGKGPVDTYKGVKKTAKVRYLSGFSRGKVYMEQSANSFSVDVHNGRPHAHLIEYGHTMLDHDRKPVQSGERFVKGKFVLRDASQAFKPQFEEAIEGFIDDMLDRGLGL